MILNSMKFIAVTNIFIRFLTYNDIRNFRKEIDNSQILMFKSINEDNTLYKLEQSQIYTSISSELIDIFNKKSNTTPIILFESNFIFEYYIHIVEDHFLYWLTIKSSESLKNYNIVCFLITYKDKIIKHSLHSNVKVKDFYLVDNLLEIIDDLNDLKIHIYLNEDITFINESHSPTNISVAPNSFFLYPALIRIQKSFRVRQLLIGSQFLYFKKVRGFLWELEKVAKYINKDELVIDISDYLVFETNLFFENIIYLGDHFNEGFIEQYFENHFLDRYIIHSFVAIDNFTNVLTDFNYYGQNNYVLDNTNYKTFVDTMTFAGMDYYLFLNKK